MSVRGGIREKSAGSGERGSAVAGFALTAGLTTLVFVIVLQFAFVLHTKAVLIDAAGQGARVAARHDSGPDQGVARTAQLLDPIAPGAQIAASVQRLETGDRIEVEVKATLPILGSFGIPGLLTARGHAVKQVYAPVGDS